MNRASPPPPAPTDLTLEAARDTLLAAAPTAVAQGLQADARLDAVLQAGLARAAAAWPWYSAAPSLLTLVAAGLDAGEPALDALASRLWEDLALLDAFRRGVAEAATLVDQAVGERVIAALVGVGAARHEADDVLQDRLCRLLGPPESLGYAGRGHLAAWLRRCAVHDWLSLRRKLAPEPLDNVEDSDGERLALALEPEVSSLAARFRPHFRAAMDAAVAALDPADRRLLRLIHVDGLSARQVGAVLGLHRVSVQRRLATVRDGLRAAVLAQLNDRFHLGTEAASSVLHALAGRVDLTLSRLLAATATIP